MQAYNRSLQPDIASFLLNNGALLANFAQKQADIWLKQPDIGSLLLNNGALLANFAQKQADIWLKQPDIGSFLPNNGALQAYYPLKQAYSPYLHNNCELKPNKAAFQGYKNCSTTLNS